MVAMTSSSEIQSTSAVPVPSESRDWERADGERRTEAAAARRSGRRAKASG
jgi:hypothetical protein